MKIYITVLIALWVVLAVLTALYDLQISQLLYNPRSTLAIYLQAYGMLPGLIVLIFAANVFYLKISKEKSFVSFLKRIFLFLTLSFFYFYFIAIVVHLFDEEKFLFQQNFTTITIISFAICFISLIGLHFIKYKPGEGLFNFSKVSLALGGIGYLILIQGTKTLWGRTRFRELDVDHLNFTDWYFPQGITGFDSFPSGHAAMAWMVLPVLMLIKNNSRYTKIFIASLIITWAIMVAASRIVMGAHFASDVTFASFLIILTFLVLKYFFTGAKN